MSPVLSVPSPQSSVLSVPSPQSPVLSPQCPQSIVIQPSLHYDLIPLVFLIKIFIKVGIQFLVKKVSIYDTLSSPKSDLLEAAMLVQPDM